MATQAIHVNDTDVPTPKRIMEIVETEMQKHGYSVSILEKCEIQSPDLVPDSGITAGFMHDETDTDQMIRTGLAFPFSIEENLNDYFGKSTGSSNVTTFFVREDLSIPKVIERLHLAGHIESSVKKLKEFTAENTREIDVVAYAIATYAKGWFVEKSLAELDRFSKGSVAQDEGGLDLYDNELGDWVQVKSVTNGKQKENHIYYQWDCDGRIHFGENRSAVNESAASVKGMPKTPLYRSHKRFKVNGRRFRYLWW